MHSLIAWYGNITGPVPFTPIFNMQLKSYTKIHSLYICTYVCISLSLLYICTIPILYIFASFEKERVWLSESLPHSRGSFQVALGPSPHCPVSGAESAANTEVWKCVVCQSALMFNQRLANQRKTTFKGSYVLSVCVIQKRSVECWIKPGKEHLLL